MKNCSKCKTSKPLECFSLHIKRGGYQSWCKECVNEYDRLRHLDNKPYRRMINKRILDRNREFLWNYLLDKSCIDCGIADPVVLEFDHVNGQKVKPVSEMARLGFSLSKITIELEKCVIRCANCHRRKTAKDFGYYRFRE